MPKMIGFNINYGLMEASTYRVEFYNRFIRIENNLKIKEFEPFKNKGIIFSEGQGLNTNVNIYFLGLNLVW